MLESDDFTEANTDVLKQDLNATIDELIERKGSSTTGREDALMRYNRFLMSHHFGDVLYGRVDAVLAALSRSIKAESSSKETVLALRAVSLTALSFDNSTLYETMSGAIKRSISDSQDNPSKAAAIECLGICLTFGGVGPEEIAENCTFLLEIIQSDGSFIGADDNAEVVTAALSTYGLLLTQLDDVEQESEDSIEALMEQLDSSNVHVQVAAGEVIALLFEKSYTSREYDEDSDEEAEGEEEESDGEANIDKNLVKRYNPYHNPSEVLDKVSNLANLSTRSLNRHDKKKLHQSFASIAMTLQDPRRGLQSNTGNRKVVRIHRDGEINVDKWWKLMRLNALRRALLGGFINHYFEGNKQVLNALPLLVQSTNGPGALSPRRAAKRPGDKYRDARKFVSAEA